MRLKLLGCWVCYIGCCIYTSQANQRDRKRLSTFDSLKDTLTNPYGRSLLSLQRRKKYTYNLRKVTVRKAVERRALCLDGSPAVFYLSHNPASSNWVMQLQAGGSCSTHKSCHQRAKGHYGSSKDYQLYMTGTFLASDDPNENPTFASWSKVFVPYCSGDIFVGRKSNTTHPYGLHMLGHFIIKAIVQQLIDDYKINSSGNIILFGGASAGGLGMLANLDHIQQLVAPAKLRGFNDGGWFTLYPSFGEKTELGSPYFLSALGVMFTNLWDGFVDESCRVEMPRAAACLYGELVIKYLTTPIYVMVAQWDSYQLKELVPSKFRPTVRLPPELPSEAEYLTKFGNNTHRSIRRLILSKVSGVFSPACFMHTFFGENKDLPVTSQYQIKGRTAYKALSEWHVSEGASGTYVEIPLETPLCNPSCCSSLCTKCRPHEKEKSRTLIFRQDPSISIGSSLILTVSLWITICALMITQTIL